MRVLHLDSGRELRGGQHQLQLLVDGLQRRVGQALAVPREAPLRIALQGCVMFPASYRGPMGGITEISRIIRRFEPDMVVAHTSRAHGVAVLATRLPVVVHRRVDFVPRQLSRWKYAAPAGFVAVSDAVADVLRSTGVPASRIRVVHDGVDPAPWRDPAPIRPIQLPDGVPWILAAGALVAHKGHATLVRALVQLPGWHLVIAGRGHLAAALLDQARALGVADRVRLIGHRADLPGLIAGCDVFVHPSLQEGLGQVVAEALVTGARIVASRAGGIPEILGDRGVLVEPGDPGALATAIRRAATLPKFRAEILPVDNMVAGTLDAWRDLVPAAFRS